MKITVEEGILDLPKGFALEIEYHHPFYSDAGSSSIPASLPASLENRRILGWPESANRAKRFIRERAAFVECGIYRKRCRLLTESAGIEGISASLAIQESEMYVDIQDRKLKDLLANKGFAMTKMTVSTPWEVYKGYHRENWYLNDVACFPVASDLDDNGNVFVINKASSDGSSLIDAARTVTIGQNSVSVPAGYGISMYLYLWALIQYAFEECGYTVKTNVFATDGRLKHLVVLNNLADLLNEGSYSSTFWSFRYSDIVPDMTVGELITWLRDKFGAIVTHDSGNIEIRLFEHLTAEDPDADLSGYQTGYEVISYPAPSGLKMTVETSIQSSEPAADSLEDLRKKYSNCAEVNTLEEISGYGLFKVLTLGKYYYRAGNQASGQTLLGSEAFPYVREASGANEEISPKDTFVPMIVLDGKTLPYIGERQHKYTEGVEYDPSDQKLMICNAIFIEEKNFCGSSNPYDEAGDLHNLSYEHPTKDDTLIGSWAPDRTRYGVNLTLTPEGLRYPFWRTHESNLLNSAPEIKVRLDIPMDVLLSYDLCFPKIFKGCKVIIKSLMYTLAGGSTVKAEAVLQMIHGYEDAIKPAAIQFNSSYSWVYRTTQSIFNGNGYTILETDGLTDYTDEPSTAPTHAGQIVMRRSRWLKYKYTKKVKKWWGVSTSEWTGTHEYEEYFIAEASE